ncbi:hypothetical protein U9M48_001037 [Paspalum notatum var. saurae]|uniref:Retrovirus-related Pol polyprotein from transposon TNT 1-94-like beta-barrel domain-containing protein n=1 Tax=Paspalum notatum var. saurae TaxID=547442 RepID=A0AAQ3PEH1_PASNO
MEGGGTSENAGKADWFVATFCTNHMTGDWTLISDPVPMGNQVVKAGEGEGLQVRGKGSVNTGTVVLPDVWYVPGLNRNLVSVGQLTKYRGLVVEMGGGMCHISRHGSVLGRAPLRSDMKYVVDFLKIELNYSTSENAGKADWSIATRCINHMTGDPALISDLVPVVESGDGAGLQVHGRGSVNTGTVVLPDVWYVPGLDRNLVSVVQLLTRDHPGLVVGLTDDDDDDLAFCYMPMIATIPPIPMDPRPSNILLVDYFRAKLSNFGCPHNSPRDVEFTVTASAKGGTEIKIGSNVIHVPKYSSVRHPLVQMVLFACKKFDDSCYCLKSISPKSIYDMAMRLCSSVWTIVCGTDWISASRKSDSPKMGTISEFDTMNYIGWRKEPTENQSHHSDPDSSRAEHGIKAVGTKTPAAWVVATGAPHHATGDRGLLSGFITKHNDQFVHAADGVPMKVLARGAMVSDAVVLPDVWFVPGLTANLVSVSQLTELDYSVGFGCGECCISAAGKVVGKAHRQDGGLYVLDFLKFNEQEEMWNA